MTKPVRVEQSVAHIFEQALSECGLQHSDIPVASRKHYESGIAADLHRQRQQPTSLSGKVLRSTLVKKYAALMTHQLKGAISKTSTSTSASHNPHVEKILEKHHRDEAWSSIVADDAKAFALMQENARLQREAQVRLQKETLDRQLEERRRARDESKAKEAAELRAIKQRQEDEDRLARAKLEETKLLQKKRQQEAEKITAKTIQDHAMQLAEEKRLDKLQAQEYAAQAQQRKDEEAARRKAMQEQISSFITQNEALIAARKRQEEQTAAAIEKQIMVAAAKQSVVPTGERRPPNTEKVLLAQARDQRKEEAARILAENKARQQRNEEFESARVLQRQVAERLLAEGAEKDERLLKELEKERYKAALELQVLQKKTLLQREESHDARFRAEVELNVRCGEAEERKLKELTRLNREQNLQFLKAQLELQARQRSGNEVAPKVV